MDRPKDSQTTKGPAKPVNEVVQEAADGNEPEFSLLTLWLTTYNWVSAILWGAVLGRVLVTLIAEGPELVYDRTGWLAKWTQSLAAMEVTHSALRTLLFAIFNTVKRS